MSSPETAAELDTVGQLVRAARDRAGLSRESLAYESEVSTSTIARLELSDRLPGALALARIARRLDLNGDDLLDRALRSRDPAP